MVAPICNTTCGAAPGSAGGGSGVFSTTQISSEAPLLVNAASGQVDVPMTVLDFDVGPAIESDLVASELVILQDGFYYVTVAESWDPIPDVSGLYHTYLQRNGATVQESFIDEVISSKYGTYSRMLELAAGDRLSVQASVDDTAGLVSTTLTAEKRS